MMVTLEVYGVEKGEEGSEGVGGGTDRRGSIMGPHVHAMHRSVIMLGARFMHTETGVCVCVCVCLCVCVCVFVCVCVCCVCVVMHALSSQQQNAFHMIMDACVY